MSLLGKGRCILRGLGIFLLLGWILPAVEAAAEPPLVLNNSIRTVETSPQKLYPHKAYVSRATLRADERGATMEFEVTLKMRNLAELQARIARGERITPAEMAAKYNPLYTDYAKVSDWLSSQGFEITRQDKNHLAVFARGKISRIQSALQVIRSYSARCARDLGATADRH